MQGPSIAPGETKGQFNLKWLLIMVAVCAVAIRSARLLGWESAAWIGAIGLAVALICYAFAIAPAATRYALTLGAVAAVFISLLACGIHQAREEARQLYWSDNLRRVGAGIHQQQNFAPGPYDPSSRKYEQYMPDRRVYRSTPSKP
ncbi:MAG: hypothetical protein L0211_08700 [Planctomycetaceae bacterium]|nr:hypothetical protein [Planctomycetaceae bacterium]